jgi:hypothetical protein
MKKAQMFVVTMIFLMGLIWVVQQNLFGYSFLDFSKPLQEMDYYLFKNVKDVVTLGLKTSVDCTDAKENLEELVYFLNKELISGYSLDLKYKLNCTYWNNTPPLPAPLNLSIHIIGKETDTTGSFEIYNL